MAQQTGASAPTAPWQSGVSTFNGTGYESLTYPAAPAKSTAKSTVESAGKTMAYTVPMVPGAANAAADFPYPVEPTAVRQVADLQFPDSHDDPMALNEPSYNPPPPIDSYDPILPPPATESPNEASVDATSQPIAAQMEAQLDVDIDGEPAPLRQDVVRWYQYPVRWMKGWDSNAEFGLDGSDGNAETLAIQTGLELKRKTDAYTFSLDVDYRQASSRDVTTEDNGRLNIDYDRLLGDSPWAVFGKLGLEWDKFKAFDLRLNMNSGLGYHWIRTKDTTLVTRFGAGASKEFGSPDDDWTPEGVFGLEAERQITSRQKIKGKFDYFPAWEDFGDYRMVTDVSWEILLDGSENLSLKLAATDRYDSTPQGAKANDLYYSLLLLYKF